MTHDMAIRHRRMHARFSIKDAQLLASPSQATAVRAPLWSVPWLAGPCVGRAESVELV